MKNRIFLTLLYSMSLFFTSCNSQTTSSKKQLQVVPILVENNSMAGYAYLLPQGFTSNGFVTYQSSNGIFPQVTLQANSKTENIKLKAQDLGQYYFSKMLYYQMQQMGINNAGTDFKVPLSVEAFSEQNIYPNVHQNYQPTDAKRITNFFVAPNRNNATEVLLTNFVNKNNPDNIAFLFSFINRVRWDEDMTGWGACAYFIEGTVAQSTTMFNIVKLVVNSLQQNPIYSNYINNINQQLLAGKKINFEIRQNSIRGMQDYFYNTLHSIQKTSSHTYHSTSEQFSNMLLDVESYTIPGQEGTYKMPASNNYYYTNSIGDFVSSNNPLFDPNTALNSIYNWTQLQKK